MAKVFLGVGHGGSDPGAVKYIKEKDVNLQMALPCCEYLVAHGVNVKMSRTRDENDTIQEEIRECNAFNPDLAVDIHNNSGGGDGFEAYHSYKGGKGKILAQNIEAEVKKIGQNSRGCKIKKNSRGTDYFGFIRQTNAPAVICEGVFVDNKADAAQADTLAEQKAFGVAYAKGILKTLGITASSSAGSSGSSGTYKVRVTASVLNIRKEPGTSSKITGTIKDKGVYTIVETRGNWGKLKSGKGWICLDYVKKV